MVSRCPRDGGATGLESEAGRLQAGPRSQGRGLHVAVPIPTSPECLRPLRLPYQNAPAGGLSSRNVLLAAQQAGSPGPRCRQSQWLACRWLLLTVTSEEVALGDLSSQGHIAMRLDPRPERLPIGLISLGPEGAAQTPFIVRVTCCAVPLQVGSEPARLSRFPLEESPASTPG